MPTRRPPEPTAEFMTITPKMAEEWLRTAIDNNRPLRDKWIDQLARDMKAKLWMVTAQAIQFDDEERLFDGQHRLKACILAATPFTSLVARNLPEQAMQAVDMGRPRRMADYLYWRKETDVFILSSVIKLSYLLEHGHLASWEWKWLGASNPAAMQWLERHPEIRESVLASRPLRNDPLKITASVAGAFHWGAFREWPEETTNFIEELSSGTRLDKGHPIIAYRNWLVRTRDKKIKYDQRIKLATLIKVFTWVLEGKTMSSMDVWQQSRAELFPELPERTTAKPTDESTPAKTPAAVGA